MISNTWNDRAKAAFEEVIERLLVFHREVVAECEARGAQHPLAQEALAAEYKLWRNLTLTATNNQLGMTDDPLSQQLAEAMRAVYGSKERK